MAARVTRGGRALRTSVKIHAVVYLAVNAVLVAIWALTGAGTFWPIWPLLGWGVALAAHWAPVAAGVGRRLPAAADLHAADRPRLASATAPDGTVTLLFSDIAGSTALNDRLGDARWMELLREHHRVVRTAVEAHGGHEVKAQGDGFMLAFAGPARALGCAASIHAGIAEALGAEGVQVRVGVHTGQAVHEEEDFYGIHVVLAARLAGAAAPGETLVSDVVRGIAATGSSRFGAPRELELRGLGRRTAFPVEA